ATPRPAVHRRTRPRDPPRPLPTHPRQAAVDRVAGQGRPAPVRRERRPRRRPALLVLARHPPRPRPRHHATTGRRVLRPQRLPQLLDLRRAELAGATHHPVRGPDSHPTTRTT